MILTAERPLLTQLTLRELGLPEDSNPAVFEAGHGFLSIFTPLIRREISGRDKNLRLCLTVGSDESMPYLELAAEDASSMAVDRVPDLRPVRSWLPEVLGSVAVEWVIMHPEGYQALMEDPQHEIPHQIFGEIRFPDLSKETHLSALISGKFAREQLFQNYSRAE